jgi:hypothetical protein
MSVSQYVCRSKRAHRTTWSLHNICSTALIWNITRQASCVWLRRYTRKPGFWTLEVFTLDLAIKKNWHQYHRSTCEPRFINIQVRNTPHNTTNELCLPTQLTNIAPAFTNVWKRNCRYFLLRKSIQFVNIQLTNTFTNIRITIVKMASTCTRTKSGKLSALLLLPGKRSIIA